MMRLIIQLFLTFLVTTIFTEERDQSLCNCSDLSWEEWTSTQIDEEFSHYEQGITKEMLQDTMDWYNRINAINPRPIKLVRYRVVDSKIYQTPHNSLVAHFLGLSVVRVLEKIIKRYPVPDIDIIYNENDSPHFENQTLFLFEDGTVPPGPILVGSKSKLDTNLILYHDHASMNYFEEIHEAPYNLKPLIPHTQFTMGCDYDWVILSRRLTQENFTPWDEKKNVLFWRGRYTDNWDPSTPRKNLTHLSELYPNLINAYEYYPQNKTETGHVDVRDHLIFKYQIAVDGNTACYPGYIWRLLSGSLVFKQSSEVYMWFERGLIPGIHYIPVKHDLSDLVDKIKWVQEHDDEAHLIAENAKRFVLEGGMPEHHLRYAYKTLLKYASLQRFIVEEPLDSELELISDPLTEEEKIERRRLLCQMNLKDGD